MTGTEIRSQLALQQAQLAILSDHARALEAMTAVGAIDLAGDQLRRAYAALERPTLGYVPGDAARFYDADEAESL